jgi:hypothetical protein
MNFKLGRLSVVLALAWSFVFVQAETTQPSIVRSIIDQEYSVVGSICGDILALRAKISHHILPTTENFRDPKVRGVEIE